MDRRALADAEAQGYRQEEQFYQKQRQKRESLADSLGDLANISDEDLANLKETNPMLYALTASGIAGSLRQVFDNVPGMREAFINNSAMSVSIKDAPEQTRNAMLGIAQGILKMSPGSDRPTANALAENPEILLEVSVKPPFNANDAESMISRFTLGEIDIMYKRINSDGSDMGPCEEGFPILDSETSFGKSLGGLFAKALDTGSLPNVWSINFDPKELMQQDFGEPLAKHGNDVIIQGEVDFSLKEKYEPLRLDDKLAKFSDATKLNVVSDSFATDTLCDFGKLPAVKFLEGLELINSCNWWKRGTTIELRNRHWFYKRSLEIPEYYLEKWRKQVEDTSTLDIDALADMAVLVGDDRQYKMNIAQDETLNNDSLKWLLQINSRILTFYATLTQSQRAAISTQAGLDLSTLTSAQKKNEYLNHWDGKMVVTKTAKGKQLEYCFIRDGKTISQITTPKYDVPKKNTQ